MNYYPLEALATEIDKQWREKDGMNCTEICALIRSTPLPDYYTRAAVMLETIRDEIGHGYGTGDIEHITSITIARLKDWDRLTRNDGTISYVLTEHLMKTIKEAASAHPTTVEVLINLHEALNACRAVK